MTGKKIKKEIKVYEMPAEGSNVNEPAAPYIAMVATSYLPKILSYSAFKQVLEASMLTVGEWAALLQVSERTMHRYAKENLSFNALESERIVLLQSVLVQMQQLFGQTAKQWLLGSSYAFNGLEPLQYLYTYAGIMYVQRVLVNIQHGVVV